MAQSWLVTVLFVCFSSYVWLLSVYLSHQWQQSDPLLVIQYSTPAVGPVGVVTVLGEQVEQLQRLVESSRRFLKGVDIVVYVDPETHSEVIESLLSWGVRIYGIKAPHLQVVLAHARTVLQYVIFLPYSAYFIAPVTPTLWNQFISPNGIEFALSKDTQCSPIAFFLRSKQLNSLFYSDQDPRTSWNLQCLQWDAHGFLQDHNMPVDEEQPYWYTVLNLDKKSNRMVKEYNFRLHLMYYESEANHSVYIRSQQCGELYATVSGRIKCRRKPKLMEQRAMFEARREFGRTNGHPVEYGDLLTFQYDDNRYLKYANGSFSLSSTPTLFLPAPATSPLITTKVDTLLPMLLKRASGDRIKIALLIPTISTAKMANISQVPLLTMFFPSLIQSIRPSYGRDMFDYTIFLGVDKGDFLYDNSQNQKQLFEAFRFMTKQLERPEMLKVKLYTVENLKGDPVGIWNALAQKAYDLGHEYLFQLNDDLRFYSEGWAELFVYTLASNSIYPNVGVTGPVDKGNKRIFTQSFVHRTHLEIFGSYYPRVFRNWWSDDWISYVYAPQHKFRVSSIRIHNTNIANTRYRADKSSGVELPEQVYKGRAILQSWISNHTRSVNVF